MATGGNFAVIIEKVQRSDQCSNISSNACITSGGVNLPLYQCQPCQVTVCSHCAMTRHVDKGQWRSQGGEVGEFKLVMIQSSHRFGFAQVGLIESVGAPSQTPRPPLGLRHRPQTPFKRGSGGGSPQRSLGRSPNCVWGRAPTAEAPYPLPSGYATGNHLLLWWD